MCHCKTVIGGEFDELLTEVCDECLDRESQDAMIESLIEEREADLIDRAELMAEWTGAKELLEVK